MKPRFQQAPLWKMCLGGLIYLILAGPFLAPVVVFGSPVVAALLIWELVRWVNRRDDPREARMPDEPP